MSEVVAAGQGWYRDDHDRAVGCEFAAGEGARVAARLLAQPLVLLGSAVEL